MHFWFHQKCWLLQPDADVSQCFESPDESPSFFIDFLGRILCPSLVGNPKKTFVGTRDNSK